MDGRDFHDRRRQLRQLVRQGVLLPLDYLYAGWLEDWADKAGESWWSCKRTAEQLNCDRRTVQRSRERLMDAGWIQRRRVPGKPTVIRLLGCVTSDAGSDGGASPVSQGCVTSVAGGASYVSPRTGLNNRIQEPGGEGTRAGVHARARGGTNGGSPSPPDNSDELGKALRAEIELEDFAVDFEAALRGEL